MSDLGNKEIMAENIRYYMEYNKIKAIDICTTLKFPMPTFSDWINAKTYPRIDKIELMANYFGISKADLVEKRTGNPKTKGIKIPVLGRVAAGIPIDAVEEIIDYEEIPLSMAATGTYFGLLVKGDSMIPDIKDGDIVIVRQQPNVENGETAVVLVNGDEATVKRVKRTDDGIMLIPNNPAYEPRYYTNTQIAALPVQIVGRVVELRRKF